MRFLCLLLPLALVAKPTGMKTISGIANCKEQSGTVVIESGKRSIVKWDEFSIAKGERVRFSMPDKKSAILNRVSGARSEILGQIDSNGKVYLLNPKGVLIGKDAIINTASFVASSLDVLDQDFLCGEEMLFSGDSEADIVNLGTISCLQGDVALIAHNVSNFGKVAGKFVGIASGPKVLLKPKGNQRIFIQAKGGASIQHSGEIKALATELRTGSVYDHAIGCSGKIEATKTEKRNGRVYLVAEHGKNNFDGEIVAKSGEVYILGDHIFMGDHANINVSDIGKAGTVLVGGDYQGMNFDLPNSLDVTVSSGATVKADGEQIGDGGKVIFWADRVMHHNGIVSARGGEEGGDGGFIEISGHQSLRDPHVQTDCRAPFGKFGTVLFDPVANVVISSAANSGMDTVPYTFSPTATPSATLNVTTLTNALANANVIVTSGSPATVTDVGSITVDATAPISWSSPTTLELVSTGFISIEANITNTSTTSGFTAMDFSTDGTTTTATGYSGITVDSGVTLSSQSGAITLTGVGGNDGSLSSTIGVLFNATAGITTTTGNVTITGTGGPGGGATTSNRGVVFSASATGISTTDGNITITGTGGGTGSFGEGVIFFDGTYACSGIGAITLIGNGAAGTTGNHGVFAQTSSFSTNSGLISITGTADPAVTSTDNGGVVFETNSAVQSTSGNITMIGSGTGGTTQGVFLSQTTMSSGAEIAITGSMGDSFGSGNTGIEIVSSSTLTVSGSGDLTLTGTSDGDGAGTSDQGIIVGGGSVVQTTGTGNIVLTGTGGSGTTTNHGVQIESATILSSAASTGSITINGVAGDGSGGTNHGVFLDSSANVTSTTGAIAINGNQTATPTTAGTFNLGVLMQNSSAVSSLGTGSTAATIAITGTGGSGTNSNRGVQIDSSSVSGIDGAITITGAPGGGTNTAVQIESSSTIETTGSDTGTTTDNITITTTSGDVVINTSTVGVVSDQSDISITTPSGGSIGISSTSSVTKTGSAGTLLINAPMVTGTDDAVTISASTVSSTDGLTITGTKTGGSGIGVNVTSVGLVTFGVDGSITGTGIDDDGISFTTAGTTITAGSGSPTITGTISPLSTIGTIRGIDMGAVAVVGGSGNLSVTGNNNATVASSNLTGIRLTGPTITQSGSGTMSFTGTGGTGTSNNYGILVNNATAITASDGTLSFFGTGGDGSSSNNHGIQVSGVATITGTSSGAISMRGNSGAGSDTDYGINVTAAGTTVSCVNGSVSLTGRSFSTSATSSSGVIIGSGALIRTTGSGAISMSGTGSAGTTTNYGIFLFESTVSSTSNGTIALTGAGGNGLSGLQGVRIQDATVTSLNGNISVTGVGGVGTGGGSHGINITAAGIVSSTGTATITCDGTAGTGAATDDGIFVTGTGSLVTSTTGAIHLTGRASGASTIGIRITDLGVVSTTAPGSAPITLRTFSDIIIDLGGTIVGGSSPVTLDSARDIIITGNAAGGGPTGILLGTGNAIISADRDVEVNGSTVTGAFAQIGASTNSSANILFPNIGGTLLVDAVDSDSYALIGHGDPTSGDTFSGNILFTFIGGGTTVIGADAGAGTAGFAQIGHIGTAAATLGGDITVRNFGGDFGVLGGTATATSIARIGHGTTGVASTFTPSEILLSAGANFNLIDGTAAVAEIVNAATGNLTLVADNQNPVPPGFSNVGITIDGTITAATGEVRLYTVDRPLNTILTTINGEVFAPPAARENNSQEQFGIYFPLGEYSTAAFRIYYKFSLEVPKRIDFFNTLLVANAELQDQLPLFRYMRLPNYPFYHTNLCEERRRRILCDPGFDPYGSLNFQDDIYWIGNSQ
ncbi:MAG: filamentous hemagglutinin N-terminal domain-containing protein [Chlamydiales bacterium]